MIANYKEILYVGQIIKNYKVLCELLIVYYFVFYQD